MRRSVLLASVLLGAAAAPAAAQSSQFGVRGIGFPAQGLSARARGMGGALGLFDSESSLNPASLGFVSVLTAGFVALPEWRAVANPTGDASLRDTRFPLVLVAGPIPRRRVTLGVSFSGYASRDFSLATADTILLRDTPVGIFDTLSSRGGINDLRFGASLVIGEAWAVGAGFHVLTGTNRLSLRRTFEDPAYQSFSQRAELSYAGIGASLGVIRRFGSSLSLAALVRSDGDVDVETDSTPAFSVDLPYTFGAGVLYRPSQRLELVGHALYRTWSGANSDLVEQGAAGSANTLELAVGAEYVGDPRRPFRRPVRLGIRYADLPFSLHRGGGQGREIAVSLGTGTRFAAQRAGVDLALERVWRSAGEAFSESAWLLAIGVSVRP
ncbi:MAG TPA: hypothetical protein VNK43_04610 [Gemmatimonadales bacterium]|nr:hypothetical protein [Gemmatimonadales bacterium]